LRAAAGVARGLHRFGQDQEQKPYHVGYGGVVVGRNPPRLAVEFGFDGYGDVSDGTHGAALQMYSGILLYWQCASKEGNYLQNGFWGGTRFVVSHPFRKRRGKDGAPSLYGKMKIPKT
jgi:hypothetical protein